MTVINEEANKMTNNAYIETYQKESVYTESLLAQDKFTATFQLLNSQIPQQND